MKKYINYIRTQAELAKQMVLQSAFESEIEVDRQVAAITEEVHANGIAVVKQFLSPETCSLLINEIDNLIATRHNELWKDDIGADYRVWGMDRVSVLASQFYTDTLIRGLRSSYYKLEDKDLHGFTMANRIEAKEGNLGSGGGWHRDVVNERQLKTILYLSDVSLTNGPFEYIRNTHKKESVLKSILDHNFEFNHNRFSESDVEKILSYPEYSSEIFIGNAGTLIVADTSGVHRGMPIQEGTRYAMTNYCWVSPSKGGNGIPKKIQNILIN
jgi:hypothetical protein